MADYETSVETQEVAEPVETTEDLGVEESEVANQTPQSEEPQGKTDRDSAFAEMRIARQEAEERAQQLEAELSSLRTVQEARANALHRLTGEENAEYKALADSLGIEVEDVMATLDSAEKTANLEAENKMLRSQVDGIALERRLDQALATLKTLDPNLTEDQIEKILGYDGINGMTVEDGYYAVKAREIMTKPQGAKPIGKLNTNEPMEKDFYTSAEVDAMTPQQQQANYKKILASMAKW